MTRHSRVCIALAAALLALPFTAVAQDTTPTLGGPLVEGVCLLSREAVFANAKVGQHANTQLQQLAQSAQAGIEAERTRLEADLERLGLRGANVQVADLDDAQRTALQQVQTLQQKAAQDGQRIEAARGSALTRISEEAQPVIAQVYTRRGCGLLLERGVVLGGNLGNDLTADVVAALDAKISTIPVSLEPAAR